MFRQYRMGFDFWALVLFLLIMLPTWLWLVVPAPNDVLRSESVTPFLDGIGTFCQMFFLFLLCAFLNQGRRGLMPGVLLFLCIGCVLVYFSGWALYYSGQAGEFTILLLTLPPCLAFLFYALHQKCFAALIPIGIFTVCHMVSAYLNHIR